MTTETRERIDISMFEGHVKPTWCPGCGDFGVLNAVKGALAELGIAPHEVLVVTGIGCGSKLPDYMLAYGLLTLHGRPLPFATGAKLANPDLHVIVVDGDGDAYGIGGNHLIHTARRNSNITHVVENNQVYGLTKGQYSPTSEHGYVSKTSPRGSIARTRAEIMLRPEPDRTRHRAPRLRPHRRDAAMHDVQQDQHLRLVPRTGIRVGRGRRRLGSRRGVGSRAAVG